MKIFYNKFLIISTIALALGGTYLYFSNSLQKAEIVPVAFGSSLSSSDNYTVEAAIAQNDKISEDISFLTSLVALKQIKIDTTLFSDKSFNKLENNTVKIEPVQAGRVNPFAPMGNDPIFVVATAPVVEVSNSMTVSESTDSTTQANTTSPDVKVTPAPPAPVVSSSKVVTDPPTQITDKTAVLNGTVNTTSGVTDAYFEYGTSDKLGTTTAIVKLSLVGTFIKNITGLTSGTPYFYKACAKINKVATCGEVVSFNTK